MPSFGDISMGSFFIMAVYICSAAFLAGQAKQSFRHGGDIPNIHCVARLAI